MADARTQSLQELLLVGEVQGGMASFRWIGLFSRLVRLLSLAAFLLVSACTDSGKVSADRAVEHVAFLAPLGAKDAAEVREGLPLGAKFLEPLWKDGGDPTKDPEAARDALERARGKTQALRVAKSTFFLLADKTGQVIRSDQEGDMLAGKNVLTAFPELKRAVDGSYVEARGSMHEARGVENKPDGQWVAAQPVVSGGATVGLYVTGWAWSLYARRVEEALKSHLLDDKTGKQPLFYAYIVVGKQAFGTRISPQVNADAIIALDPVAHLNAEGVFRAELEITGRSFGLAAKAMPELGPDVLVAVLRSET